MRDDGAGVAWAWAGDAGLVSPERARAGRRRRKKNPTFRRMPTANAEGQIRPEGGIGKVSVRRVFRCPLDRHGPSVLAVGMLRDVGNQSAWAGAGDAGPGAPVRALVQVGDAESISFFAQISREPCRRRTPRRLAPIPTGT